MEIPELTLDPNFQQYVNDLFIAASSETHETNPLLFTLYSLQEQPFFCFYLIPLLSNESYSPQIRVGACSMFKSSFVSSPPQYYPLLFHIVISSFLPLLNDPVVNAIIPSTISTVIAFIKGNGANIPDIREQIYEYLQNPETTNPTLILIKELARERLYLDVDVFDHVIAFINPEHIKYALEALYEFSGSFQNRIYENILETLFTIYPEMDAEVQKNIVRIVCKVFPDFKDSTEIAEFLHQCILSEDETITVESVHVFESDAMYPFYNDICDAICQRISENDTMTDYNISLQCYLSLKKYISNHTPTSTEYLFPQVQSWVQSEDLTDVRRAIRSFAALVPYIEDIESVMQEVMEYTETSVASDAAFFLKEVCLVYPAQIPTVLEVLFSLFQSTDRNLRDQLFDSLQSLLPIAKIDAEPFLPTILQLLANPSQEENIQILQITGLFCESAVNLDEQETATQLASHALDLFVGSSEISASCSYSLYILASLLPKMPSIANDIVSRAAQKLSEILTMDHGDDESLLLPALMMCKGISDVQEEAHADYSEFLVGTIPLVCPYLEYGQVSQVTTWGEAWKVIASYIGTITEAIADSVPSILEMFFQLQSHTNSNDVISGAASFWLALLENASDTITVEFAQYAIDLFNTCLFQNMDIEETNLNRQNIAFALLKTYALFLEAITPEDMYINQIAVTRRSVQEELTGEWDELIEQIITTYPQFRTFFE